MVGTGFMQVIKKFVLNFNVWLVKMVSEDTRTSNYKIEIMFIWSQSRKKIFIQDLGMMCLTEEGSCSKLYNALHLFYAFVVA